MFCKQCGIELNTDSGKCPKCGTTIGKGGRFCENCGKKIVNPKEPCECKNNTPVPEMKKDMNDSWVCGCGTKNTGNFCQSCGNRKDNMLASNSQNSGVTERNNQVSVETPEVAQTTEPTKNTAVPKPVETVKKPVNQPQQFKNPVFAKIAAQSKENNTAADDILKETAIKLVYGKDAVEELKNKSANIPEHKNKKISETVKSDVIKPSNNSRNETKNSNPVSIPTPVNAEKIKNATKHNSEPVQNPDNTQGNVSKKQNIPESLKTATPVVSGEAAKKIQNDMKVEPSEKTEQGKRVLENMFGKNSNSENNPDISKVYPVLNREDEIKKSDFKKAAEYKDVLKPDVVKTEKPFIDTFWVAGLFLGLLGIIANLLKTPYLYTFSSLFVGFVFCVLDIIIGKKKYGLAVLISIVFAALIFMFMPIFIK